MLDLEKAFVLHTIPFNETSLLATLLNREVGLLKVIAKGARNLKSPYRGFLLPFIPLKVNYGGRGDVKTLYRVETFTNVLKLSGERLFCGFYINELMYKLLRGCQSEVHQIFSLYHQTLILLTKSEIETVLRKFEKNLLILLGYQFPLNYVMQTKKSVEPNSWYRILFGKNWLELIKTEERSKYSFKGTHLLAFERDDYGDPKTLKIAKILMRLAINNILAGAEIKSRDFFINANLG